MNKKTNALILGSTMMISLMIACGGGGVSQEFTKEINEFETAWTNTGTSFLGIVDSVKATKQQWDAMLPEMKVPDTLVERFAGDKAKKLDSVKVVCGTQNQSCTAIMDELEKFKVSWDKETNAFTEWKDKVLKGEIDIETAKKDLVAYKTKLTDAGNKSTEAYNKLSELKVACAGNCTQYNEMIAKFAAEEPEDKPRRRRGR